MKQCPRCATRFEGLAFLCPQCGFRPRMIEGIPAFAPEKEQPGMGGGNNVYDQLAAVEDGNFWFRARNKLICHALDRFFPTAANMLEIGCGTGYVLKGVGEHKPELTLFGSELSVHAIGFAADRLCDRAGLFQMNAEQIPFVKEFDVIGAFDVLEHIACDDRVLQEMYKAVSPGGGVLIIVPQHAWLWSGMDTLSGHLRRYTAGELKRKMEQAGFRCVYSTSFVSLLLPAMICSRMRRYRTHDQEQAISELTLPGVLNAMLESVLLFELCLIRAGLRFPAGGSLLMVGKVPG